MPALAPYAGADHPEPEPIAPERNEAEQALRATEDENNRLRETVRTLEAALRTAGRILLPYVARTGNGRP
jgi:hypothetical protein